MKIKIILFLLLLSVCSFAQEKLKTTDSLDKLGVDADQVIGYDKFDFLYFIKNNTLHKLKSGALLTYKNLALGTITKVDLLNPLKILVFYEQFNTLVTLDRQLNETLKINFSELKTPLIVSKIGISSQNKLWAFDEITSQIYLYDTGNAVLKSVGAPISEEIVYYTSDFNFFEWLDNKQGWYQCSVFGNVVKLDYHFDFDKILASTTELIFYRKGSALLIFNRNTKQIVDLEILDKSFKSLTYKNQILSIFTNQEISNYKITIP